MMFCETFYTETVREWDSQSDKVRKMLWNEYFDATGNGEAIMSFDPHMNIGFYYETEQDYQTALVQNRYNPNHPFYFFDKDGIATTLIALDADNSPYDETALLDHLKPIVLAEIAGKLINEQGDDTLVLSLCHDYIQANSLERVRNELGPNDFNCATQWLAKTGLTKTTPSKWQAIYDKASLEVDRIYEPLTC